VASRDPCLRESLKILSIRQYSAGEVREKLRNRGFLDESIESALKRLMEYGYIDDLDLMKTLVEIKFTAQGYGRRRVKDYLLRRKIPEGLIVSELDLLITREDSVKRGLDLLSGGKNIVRKATRGGKGKIFQYLARRGFDFGECKDIIFEYEKNSEGN